MELIPIKVKLVYQKIYVTRNCVYFVFYIANYFSKVADFDLLHLHLNFASIFRIGKLVV